MIQHKKGEEDVKHLVNYKIVKGKFLIDNLIPEVEIVNIDNKVWNGMPIGLISPLEDSEKLYITGEGNIVGLNEALKLKNEIEKNTKLFKFSLDKNGRLKEDSKGEIISRLPKNIDIDKLDYVNGEILLMSNEEE